MNFHLFNFILNWFSFDFLPVSLIHSFTFSAGKCAKGGKTKINCNNILSFNPTQTKGNKKFPSPKSSVYRDEYNVRWHHLVNIAIWNLSIIINLLSNKWLKNMSVWKIFCFVIEFYRQRWKIQWKRTENGEVQRRITIVGAKLIDRREKLMNKILCTQSINLSIRTVMISNQRC